jgi:pyrroline-5-carboxylate reductase
LTAVTATSLSKLIEQVASKGGTTEAALKILAKGGSWEQAAEAALKRAKELSKKE